MKHARVFEAAVAVGLICMGVGLLFSYPVALVVAGVLILIDRLTS